MHQATAGVVSTHPASNGNEQFLIVDLKKTTSLFVLMAHNRGNLDEKYLLKSLIF